ncbi:MULTISPECIES: helix-turn-helix domain-containing protein [unclassified Paenibacillus]|uniref:helix-turn-helix domain-containing protein n=1 Tax=unclassified Paenibacillus TaxID=185978 RepID=UPI0030F8C81D
MLDTSPGEKLRLMRLRKKLTQTGLAMAINDRMPKCPQFAYQMLISRFEQEKEIPSNEMILLIESILDSVIWTASESNTKVNK